MEAMMHVGILRLSRAYPVAVLLAVLVVVSPVGVTVTWSAEKEKPAKKDKSVQPSKKGTTSKGATTASGAGIVDKATACFGDTPKIEHVKPDEGKSGDKVTITGKNFGAPGCLSSVSFGPGSPATFVHVNETTVTATVPPGKKGVRLLTVTTASGEDSKPFFVK
jgi:IPT/TIG domain-containing protein